MGFSGGSVAKNPPVNLRDTNLNPRSVRALGVRNGNLLQYSCLGNSMDRGAWQATVYGFAKSQTRLSMHACTQI